MLTSVFLAFDFKTCFASHSVSNILRRVNAQQALLRLQEISADCLDGKYSDSELDDTLKNDAQVELDSSGEESKHKSVVIMNVKNKNR